MEVIYTRQASKALRKMPSQDADALESKIADYAAGRSVKAEKLKGRDEYRIRHGQWRAVFRLENGNLVLVVIKVAHRREVYR